MNLLLRPTGPFSSVRSAWRSLHSLRGPKRMHTSGRFPIFQYLLGLLGPLAWCHPWFGTRQGSRWLSSAVHGDCFILPEIRGVCVSPGGSLFTGLVAAHLLRVPSPFAFDFNALAWWCCYTPTLSPQQWGVGMEPRSSHVVSPAIARGACPHGIR